ncbi:non-ribosomal peptide synthetase [Brevibacillus sp. Leaf182]|uniref:non-ribosomal peptide synthetase n=1 Tax=Brevibacillus sp. Leaf182 TaxID=1736290 RepID=UPI0006F33FE3|nr:non-ribosomal peptide synthetase [Brevibacillus sp. Leaf182]RAT98496.1 non-ribosomal peptide synthetase [Brevibacillus sp. Leaf182]
MQHLTKENVGEVIELSKVQKQFLRQDMITTVRYLIKQPIERERAQEAWNELVSETPLMRTVFRKLKNKYVQVVLKQFPISIDWHDLRGLSAEQQEQRYLLEIASHQEPIAFEEGPLIRLSVMQMEENQTVIIWTNHTLCMDDVSRGLLLEEWLKRAKGNYSSNNHRTSFKDYFIWESSQDGSITKSYWIDKINHNDNESVFYPVQGQGAQQEANQQTICHAVLSEPLSQTIKSMAFKQGVSIEAVFQAAWLLLLNMYSGDEKVAIGVTVSGRPESLEGADTIIGPLAHSLPVFMTLQANQNVCHFVKIVQISWEELQQNQFITQEMIRNYAGVPEDHPLIGTTVTVVSGAGDDYESVVLYRGGLPSLEIMVKVGQSIQIQFIHPHASAKRDLERLQSHYIRILEQVCSDFEMKISDLNAMTDEEQNMMTNVMGNFTKSHRNMDQLAQQIIEERVKRNPDAVAAVYMSHSITYRELNETSNRLAHWLRREGFGRNDLAAIFLERSIDMLVGILAVLKAGGCYVPLDTAHPDQRLVTIMENSKAKVILTEASYQLRSMTLATEVAQKPIVFCLNEGNGVSPDKTSLQTADTNDPKIINAYDDLANVFFTSGSTGIPKGAMIEHRGMLNHLFAKIDVLDLNQDSIVVQNASHCFDISVWQFLAPLMVGGKVVIYDNETATDPELLFHSISRDKVTVIQMVPAMIEAVHNTALAHSPEQQALPHLQYMISTGEGLPVTLCKKWQTLYPEGIVVNTYGATECSDDTMHEIIDRSYQHDDYPYVALGNSIGHMKHYLLDKWMRPVPIGCVGEIYISGMGVGRGYVNDPERTEHAFSENPFLKEKKERLYKTGDLGRYLPSGRLVFVTRADFQVKVRGHRIELGEIESALLRHESVRQCVAVVSEDRNGDNRIVSYVVLHEKQDEQEFQQYLKTILPEYMIPERIMILDAMPLNRNGKVDKKALPTVDTVQTKNEAYVAPRNDLERRLAAIWSTVLSIDDMGIDDDFFQLGGHSMKTIQVRLRMKKELGIEVTIKDLFEHRTIRELSSLLAHREESASDQLHTSQERTTIHKAEEKDYYPVSHAQRRLFFIQQLEPQSTAYNMPTIYHITGPLKERILHKAFSLLVQRHEVLRTKFLVKDGHPVQQVLRNHDFTYSFVDVSKQSEAAKQKAIQLIMQQESETYFDLESDALFRVKLCKVAEEKYTLLLNMHHMISDQWSWGILLKDFSQIYESLQQGIDPVLPALHIQYKDYAVWQNHAINHGELAESEAYWLKTFQKEIPVLDLPTDYQRQPVQTFFSAVESYHLPENIFGRMREIAQQYDASMFMVTLSVVGIWLSKLTNQQDIIIGTPEAGRNNMDIEEVIGFFVNTLPLRLEVNMKHTFVEALQACRQLALESYAHNEYPFDKLVEKINPERDVSRNPIFSFMFQYIEKLEKDGKISGLEMKAVESYNSMTNFDLSLVCLDQEDGASLSIEYRTDLFRPETVQRMLGYLHNIIEQVTNQPTIFLKQIELLSAEEKQATVSRFIDVHFTNGDENKTIIELFEEQSARTPDHIAVVFEEQELSYSALNKRANQLARTLVAEGVCANQLVGIMAERSIEMIVGVLAILKAGGAYIPIDPDYPDERIRYMLEHSGAEVFLLHQALREKVDFDKKIIVLDDHESYHHEHTNLGLSIQFDQLAYVIYTSGTTGKPKGVMIEHQQLQALAQAWKQEYKLDEFPVRCLQWASFAFDVFTGDYIRSLLYGGKLVICPADARIDLERIYQLMEKHEINLFESTPVLLIPLMNDIYEKGLNMDFMKILILGSDQCPLHVFHNLVDRYGHTMRIINSYGVTEATIDASYYEKESQQDYKFLPIGKPLPGVNMYILDVNGNVVPVGIPGELYIGGRGVGRGYFKQPDLTNEKFVQSPFCAGEKLYKTGDMARWLPSGNIEFLGRFDNQVKIRGNRIELEEIEAELLKTSDIQEAVVIPKEDGSGQKRLVAFYVAAQELEACMVRDALRKTLPAYMVPSYFVQLDEIPVTPNGKIDRKALTELNITLRSDREFVEPKTEIEKILVSVWQDVLHEKQVGILDNFFELGGDSIKSIQVASQLSGLGYKMEIRDLFTSPTIAELGTRLKPMKQKIDQRDIEGAVQLTPIQHWFFQEHNQHPHHYNQSFMLYRKDRFDERLVRKGIEKLLQHHDALRMVFRETETGYQAYNRGVSESDDMYSLEVWDYRNITDANIQQVMDAQCTAIQSRLHIFDGPLIRLGLFQCDNGDHLLMAVHHLLVDGVSWRILIEDFNRAYLQLLQDKEMTLPLKSDSYQLWAQKLNEYAHSDRIEVERAYWNRIEEMELQSLPTDYVEWKPLRKQTRTKTIVMDEQQTRELLKQANRAYHTEIDELLLSAIGLAFKKWANIDRFAINLEGHGRESILPDVEINRTVGWFTSEYPVIVDVGNEQDLSAIIHKMKKDVRQIPHKGIHYGILKYLAENPRKNNIKPEVSFNYLGQFDLDRKEEDGDIQLSTFSGGESMSLDQSRECKIDIECVVLHGRFQFMVAYSENQYKNETIDELMACLQESLCEIIQHCLTKIHNSTDRGLLGESVDFEGVVDGFFDASRLNDIPGAVVVVVHHGQVQLKKAYGYANRNERVRMSADETVMKVGSISKIVTVAAIIQLVEQGLIGWNDDIQPYLDDMEIPRKVEGPLTVEHLLSYTAGFDEPFTGNDQSYHYGERESVTLQEYIQRYMPTVIYQPGEQYCNENFSFMLAGYLVERVTGVPFHRYVSEKLFKPLEMRRSSFLLQPELEAKLATGYDLENNPIQRYDFSPADSPDGSLLSTGDDMAKWMLTLLNKGAYGTERVLNEDSISKMFASKAVPHPQGAYTGYGFTAKFHPDYVHENILAKAGEVIGYNSFMWLLPEKNLGVFISTNKSQFNKIEFFDYFMKNYHPAETISI